MATTGSVDTTIEASNDTLQGEKAVDVLATELEKVEIQTEEDTQAVQTENTDNRPRIIYTRSQLLDLSLSPLVKPPDSMPSFKTWFGEWSEASAPSAKKDSESLGTNGGPRGGRYRRETEDGDGTSRPPFRSTLSQPSQMGNFKHQPLRSSDRDRERDSDLRTLSDKYDRERGRGDRIGLPTHSTLLRNRDRDPGSHLGSERESQRQAARKRNGESKEDWRRGAEPPRSNRDEHHTRRDREDRERQRSRARDGSRQRGSPPSSRKDRDRDDHRKDRDRFGDADDDGRRWRDDGKREERMNARREKEKGRDRSRDPDERDGWTVSEDRAQKRAARERKYEESRDKGEKKDQEKEKEPAWMETYIPSPSSGGILGGKGDGEVDSIQAWKKDMKEREMRAKGITIEAHETLDETKQAKGLGTGTEGQLDEIQLFKLMMKQEEQKRAANSDPTSGSEERPVVSASGIDVGLIRQGRTSAAGETSSSALSDATMSTPLDPLLASKAGMSLKNLTLSTSATSLLGVPGSLSSNGITPRENNGPRLLSLKSPESVTNENVLGSKDILSPTSSFDPPRQSRLLAFGAQNGRPVAQPMPQNTATAAQMNRLQQNEQLWPNQRHSSTSPAISIPSSQQQGIDKSSAMLQTQMGQFDNVNINRQMGLESSVQPSLVFDNMARSSLPLDNGREFMNPELNRSSLPLSSLGDRGAYISPSDGIHQLADPRRNPSPPIGGFGVTSPISPIDGSLGSQTTYASGKGSRMAKHFERQRETVNTGRNPQAPMNGVIPGRQEPQVPLVPNENRNIQDLLTMLNNSAQAQRQLHGITQNVNHHQQPQSLPLGPSNSLRHDSLLDPDEGRFAPDGLVPGLRPAHPPRSREVNNGNLYTSHIDDTMAFNARLGQQRGVVDQIYTGPLPTQFNGQGPGGNRGNLGFQQQQALRGGPSPINNYNPAQGSQRLPPGLANLGGRPPHEPNQFVNPNTGNFGIPSQLHGGLQHAGNPQLSQLQMANLGLVGAQGQLRGQPNLGAMQNALGAGLGGLEFRNGPGVPAQNQLLGLGNPNLGQGLRGGHGFNGQQLHGPNQMAPLVNLRQQHNLQPQLQLPPQFQGISNGQHNDLMALLMGGAHRD